MPSHRAPKRSSKRASKRTGTWSDSVLGSHARMSSSDSRRSARSFGGRRDSVYGSHRSARSLEDRTAEITQMRPHATTVDSRTRRRSGATRVQEVMRRRRALLAAGVVAVAAAIVVLAFNLGSCAFKGSVSSNVALDDPTLQAALAVPEEGSAYNTLVVGINESDPGGPAASWLMLVRANPEGGRMTFLDVPSNIAWSTSGHQDGMLRDLLRDEGPAALVDAVSDVTGVKIAHYVGVSSTGLAHLVDEVGGVEVDVRQVVDDPRVSSVVIDPGVQTLDEQQALAFVSAFNYAQDARSVRAQNQADFMLALIQKFLSREGLSSLAATDTLSNVIKTDLDYDGLQALAQAFRNADPVTTAMLPGKEHLSSDKEYFYTSSDLPEVMELFSNGEDPQINVDTSGIDKSKVTMVVLNGSGTNGLAVQAADLLTAQGWTVSDTGNAESYVFDETLVVYREEKDLPAAQAVVDDLGLGRAVYASVYYSLDTDLQVNVGKDWISRS